MTSTPKGTKVDTVGDSAMAAAANKPTEIPTTHVSVFKYAGPRGLMACLGALEIFSNCVGG